MIKTVKCGIAAAVVVAAGIAAFQSYGSYGTQDNSLLMQNVEALAQGPDGGDGDNDATGAQLTNKAKKWNYSKVYNITGWKAGVDVEASVRAILAKLIGKSQRADGTLAANIEKYTVYTWEDVYQEQCLDVPGANCICDPANNMKWFKKPTFTPSWWKLDDDRCN